MSTVYMFIRIQDSSQGSFFTMDAKNIDPKTIEWINKTGKVPWTEGEMDDIEKLEYVPLKEEHIINSGNSYNIHKIWMEGPKNMIVVISSLQYD